MLASFCTLFSFVSPLRFEAGRWWETDTTIRALDMLSKGLISQVRLVSSAGWASFASNSRFCLQTVIHALFEVLIGEISMPPHRVRAISLESLLDTCCRHSICK
jgi:hypothetical protein